MLLNLRLRLLLYIQLLTAVYSCVTGYLLIFIVTCQFELGSGIHHYIDDIEDKTTTVTIFISSITI